MPCGSIDVLGTFDPPFDQAPSLHVALPVILWARFHARVPRAWRWLLHGWFTLVGLSVLTAWQHHFVDVPTGALPGFACLWLWPGDDAERLIRSARPRIVHAGAHRASLAALGGAGAAP